MKAKSFMHQRMELLAIGEQLGWPRLPVGINFPAIRAGQFMWEKAARGNERRVMAALRNAKIRRDNLGGQPDTFLSRVKAFDVAVREDLQQKEVNAALASNLTERRRMNLAKARAAKAARKAAKKEALTSQ